MMGKRTRIALALMIFVLGITVFVPELVKATAPVCNPGAGPGGDNRSNCQQYCSSYGDITCYPSRPTLCPNGQPPPPGRPELMAGTSARGRHTGVLPQGGSASGGGVQETYLRQRTSTMLSLLTLVAGLGAVALLLGKLSGYSLKGQLRWNFNAGHLLPRARAAGLVALIVMIGLAPVACLLSPGTHASNAASPRAAHRSPALPAEADTSPKFGSARQIGGAGITQIGGTAIDAQGNTYVAGGFFGQIPFATAPQPTTLNSTESYDVFIAKYDPAGVPLWARMANGATNLTFTDPDTNKAENFSYDGALALAVDAQGDVYVGGGFVKSLSFKDASGNMAAELSDNVEPESDEINFELFVAKYDTTGTLLWARGGQSGALDDPEDEEDLDSGINGITDIVLDNAGNPYVAGTFSGTNFLGQEVLTEGGREVLLSRLDPATGSPVWVSTPGSDSTDGVMGLAIDAAANLYLIGDMGGTITFPTEPAPTTLTLEDSFGDTFIAKYDQHGQALWAKQIGGTQPIDGEHIAVSNSGHLYLTGAFEGTANFDSITLTDQSDGSGSSGFLTKYTTDGNAVWARSFGRSDGESSDGDTVGQRVAVDAAGNPYVSGLFEEETSFGLESPAMARTLVSSRLEDHFIAHYDAEGNFRWVKQPVEGGDDSFLNFSGTDLPIEVLPVRLVYHPSARELVLTGDFRGTLALDDVMLDSGTERHAYVATLPLGGPQVADFDGDGRTDISVWQSDGGKWHIIHSADSTAHLQFWGQSSLGDQAVPGDYDGDGKTDLAIYRPAEGNWYILQSQTNIIRLVNWGVASDRPVPADYDGDGKTDCAVFRPSEGNWYILQSNGGQIVQGWGDPTDKLVPGDYDGDGRADIAVFRPSEGNWFIRKSTGGLLQQNWGLSDDQPVPADYDGDKKFDIAVWRPAEGNWFIIKSTGGASIRSWGDSTDQPVPGDYDSDGKTDIAVWRPSEGTWYIIRSATNTGLLYYLGGGMDTPIPAAHLPQ